MLTAADRQCLDEWVAHARARPQVLPPGLQPVQTRLVRAVGRGALPDAGDVYAKLMWFPRFKDRLRYLLRPLPAVHEAAMLRHCRAAGVPVPEVVSVATARVFGCPVFSMLTTAALPGAPGEPAPDAVAAVTGQLLGAGVFHPDLNAGNFVPLEHGVAVLDLQSARRRRVVAAGERAAMLAKLLAGQLDHGRDPAPLGAALVAARVCDADGLRAAEARAAELHRRAIAGRIRRCLQESTEFTVTRRPLSVRHRRRAFPGAGEWVEGGPELVRYWMGDRSLEILDGRPPLLCALVRPAAWWPGRCRVCVRAGGAAALSAAAGDLLAGHARYLELDGGRG